MHGPMGEDGTIQGMLELAGIPYVGAGVLGSAVGMDKDVMKRLLRDAGIPTAGFRTLRRHEYRRNPQAAMRSLESLGFPLFVKPANLGSSVGVSRVVSRSELPHALDKAFLHDTKLLAEEAIVGREIECAVLGNDEPVASIPGEIVVTHADGFYSYEAKYLDERGATLAVPAALDAELTREVQRLSIAAFRVLECSGMARVDFFVTSTRRVLVNEINTIPGFTAMSMYPKLWSASEWRAAARAHLPAHRSGFRATRTSSTGCGGVESDASDSSGAESLRSATQTPRTFRDGGGSFPGNPEGAAHWAVNRIARRRVRRKLPTAYRSGAAPADYSLVSPHKT